MTGLAKGKIFLTIALILTESSSPSPDELWSSFGPGNFVGTLNTNNGSGIWAGKSTVGRESADSLAFDSESGVPYTIVFNDTEDTNRLATINITSGVATPLSGASDIGSAGPFSALEIACDGTVYAVWHATPTLHTLNKMDGSVTNTTDITNITEVYEIAFDTKGVLWAADNSTPPQLFTVALPSGAVTFKGPIGGDFPSWAQLGGIAFDQNGTLYATEYIQFSTLYTVDKTTLNATALGRTGFPFPVGLDAFPGECPPTTVAPSSSSAPTAPTNEPSSSAPTNGPTVAPSSSSAPTAFPTNEPSSSVPTNGPTVAPSSVAPSLSSAPTAFPTNESPPSPGNTSGAVVANGFFIALVCNTISLGIMWFFL